MGLLQGEAVIVTGAGWSVGALKEFFSSAAGRKLQPVGLGAETYAYYGGVGLP